ncbi:hypothetical protein RN001_001914 [Aquatica leii]|uniref:Prostaglandin reductase 1 n=1 Tax=Aquatica leii TaxID=1421715 RepID=A0AAN7SR24_9COLE|nr:hypothetical protein RN001_001914 [Aquatica leii]
MVTRRKFILVKQFDHAPKESDLKIVEEKLPSLKKGEFLCEAVYLSVDPYMRAYIHKLPVGSPMNGRQVARIVESKSDEFQIGKYVVGNFDWQTHTVSSKGGVGSPYIVPNLGDLPLSLSLGVLGMPGNTAYFSFVNICKPKAGETIVVSGAAGAVGNIVGQVAKMKGCKVIGITGSDQKGKYLTETLGFDSYVNYKLGYFEEELKKAAPLGIDCYFDNVAGEISVTVMKHMNMFGRICNCGSISSYNTDVNHPPKVSPVQLYMLLKQLFMEGFQASQYVDRIFESMNQHMLWIQEGKLKYIETITEGFENTGKAFIEMLEGKNLGKAIVKV